MELNFFPRFCELPWIKNRKSHPKISLPDGESNPGLPRDRRGYLPLYYRGLTHAGGFKELLLFNQHQWNERRLFLVWKLWFWWCVNVTFKYQLIRSDVCENCSGPTEIRTRIAGFKVQSANHYTIGPDVLYEGLRRLYSQCAPNLNEIARIRIFIDKI